MTGMMEKAFQELVNSNSTGDDGYYMIQILKGK